MFSTLFSVTTITCSNIFSCSCLIEKCDKIRRNKRATGTKVCEDKKAQFHVSDFVAVKMLNFTRELKRPCVWEDTSHCLSAGSAPAVFPLAKHRTLTWQLAVKLLKPYLLENKPEMFLISIRMCCFPPP